MRHSKTEYTPMMEQYLRLKRENEDAVLLFNLGDFFETFFDDAKTASEILQIALTSRELKGKKIPMAGIPCHAAQRHIGKLLQAGKKVAICEQVEDPKLARGLVRRETTRIITPGTVLDESLLDEKTNNFLTAIASEGGRYGLATVDVSTGEFRVTELEGEEALVNEIGRIRPRECLVSAGWVDDSLARRLEAEFSAFLTSREDWHFMHASARELILKQFAVSSLEGFGLEHLPLAVSAAGAIVQYLQETQKTALEHLVLISAYSTGDSVILDPATQRNLELTSTLMGERGQGTLLSLLDETVTSMGGRLIRSWLLAPLARREKIGERLDAVEALVEDRFSRDAVRQALRGIADMERLLARIACGTAGPRELVSLRMSLEKVTGVRQAVEEQSARLVSAARSELDSVEELVERIGRTIVDAPPLSAKDGGIVRDGFDASLDELRRAKKDGKSWIAELERKEVQRTGIGSLKVRFNRVLGYSIEVTKPNLARVPADYVRRQTLSTVERFTTQELNEQETRILGAEERALELELEIFNKLREEAGHYAARILKTAGALALVDVVSSLAEVAARYGYVKPTVIDDNRIRILEGRHPVLEHLMPAGSFVPNDVELDSEENQILIITGPNMAGKSTYIRQVATIVIMAQMGSFVPAREVELGPVDRVFTRAGATDELARGRSTFMVEMNETAAILNSATSRSLVVLDEIGRGTSTFDGVSIAWAVAEYLHGGENFRPRCLFATHYHELTALSATLPRVKNYNVAVREWGDRVVFLRKVVPGGSDRSYGIHVARLAGLPGAVVERAKEILETLEGEGAGRALGYHGSGKGRDGQLELFRPAVHPVVSELSKIDVERLTPLEALSKLSELLKKLRE